MINFAQLKNTINEAEFSNESKREIDQILEKAERAGGFTETEKAELLEEIKLDMTKDLMEAEGCKIILEEIDKLLAGV